jgi:hypothetical protein
MVKTILIGLGRVTLPLIEIGGYVVGAVNVNRAAIDVSPQLFKYEFHIKHFTPKYPD